MRLTVLDLASLEKKKRKRKRKKKRKGKKKKKKIFYFFCKIRFLAFYKAELESEDILVLRRVRAFHRYPFC